MARWPSGLKIDNPAMALVQSLIAYWGVTTAAGAVGGTTLVDAGLALQPSYANQMVVLFTTAAAGQHREISAHPAGTNTATVAVAFTDNAGAAVQVPAGTPYAIIGTSAIGRILAILQTAEVGGTYAHPSGVAEQVAFTFNPAGLRTELMGVWLDLVNLTQNTTIRTQHLIDGVNWRTFDTLAWTPAMDDGVYITQFNVRDQARVSVQSAVAEGAPRDIPYYYIYRTVE